MIYLHLSSKCQHCTDFLFFVMVSFWAIHYLRKYSPSPSLHKSGCLMLTAFNWVQILSLWYLFTKNGFTQLIRNESMNTVSEVKRSMKVPFPGILVLDLRRRIQVPFGLPWLTSHNVVPSPNRRRRKRRKTSELVWWCYNY